MTSHKAIINLDPTLEHLEISGLEKPLESWQLELVEIAMLPRALRPPIAETIGRLGITEWKYSYWLRHPLILKAKRILTRRYFQNDIPDILQAMRDEAIAGDSKCAQVFLKYVDEWGEVDEDNRAIKREVLSKVAVQQMLTEFRNKKV